jgi:hypothetical protein
MYKHAEHRPHRAANKHQQRENHPPHHLRRQEQPDLRHLQLLLPKKEDRERHEPPRLPFVEATSSLNLESWSFSSLAVWFRTFPARSSKGPRCHHHCGCWPRRPLCVLSGRPSFCSETSSNGLVEFASIPTRRNPDVKRDDTHPPPKGRRCRDQTTCQGRVPLRRPGDERRDCPVTATAPRTAQIITPLGPVSSTAKGRLHALSQQRTFSAPLTNSANFFRA